MSKTKETAGKTARRGARCAAHSKATPKKWRTARRDGRTVDVSPDGRTVYGTAQEVRDADMMPWKRDSLAARITILRRYAYPDAADRADLLDAVAEARRAAVREASGDAGAFALAMIPPDLLMEARAAARVYGEAEGNFIAKWVREMVECARGVTGGELPLTRHEKAALARIARKAPENGARGVCA